MSKKVKTETKVKTKKRLDKVQFEESKKPFKRSKPLVIPVSPSRDRRLAGKTRRLARKAENREKRLDKVQFEESKKPFKRSKPLVIPVSPSRDRRLAGKTRRLARKAENRA